MRRHHFTGEHQAIGREVRGFDESVWVLFREGIVFTGNYARFNRNSEQREMLFSTRGTTLVEASPHDRVWGIGLAADDSRALDRSKWLGFNLLGEALTRVREALLFEDARAEPRQAEREEGHPESPAGGPDHSPAMVRGSVLS